MVGLAVVRLRVCAKPFAFYAEGQEMIWLVLRSDEAWVATRSRCLRALTVVGLSSSVRENSWQWPLQMDRL